jgi:ribosomal protein L24
MVIAGIKNKKNHGPNKNKVFKSAAPVSNILLLNIQKNKPIPVKKTVITTYAIKEFKKAAVSF